MSGHGGHKHRVRALKGKRNRRKKLARANIVRVRKQFEDKGQEWDPARNPQQAAALSHLARRAVSRSEVFHH